MTRPVVLDLTRLASRFVNATPNGIDRVDAAFARHFFQIPDTQGLLLHPWGPRLIDTKTGARIARVISARWGECDTRDDGDAAIDDIAAWMRRAPDRAAVGVLRLGADRRGATRTVGFEMARATFGLGQAPHRAIVSGAVYVNVSQFPLWNSAYFRWAKARPDVRIVPFIHDLLPLQHPEFFRSGEAARHRKRLCFVAARAAAAIVTTDETARSLRAFAAGEGRAELPVHVAHLPVDPLFNEASEPDERLAKAPPFFVLCGTIEPRKNHLLILDVWRDMVRQYGEDAPRLILVGRRGWKNAAILDRLAHDATLSGHVLEVSDLATPALRTLLDHACGALVPSFAEGFGLPVAEACAVGTPLIVSDLPVFREIAGETARYLDPGDVSGWTQAILELAHRPKHMRRSQHAGSTWPDYFAGVERFLASLPVNPS